jgi:hypothetical protein
MDCTCSLYGAGRDAYRISRVKSLGKQLFGRPTIRWHNNVNMCLRKICCENGSR